MSGSHAPGRSLAAGVIAAAMMTSAVLAPALAIEMPITTKEIATYPFFASPERALAIRSGFVRIVAGHVAIASRIGSRRA